MAASWVWSGGLTDTGITVGAKVGAGLSCRLAVSTDPTMATGKVYSAAVTSDADGYVLLPITGLTANTSYTYGVEIGGVLDAMRGTFVTAPVAAGSPASFTWAFSSCNVRSSSHKVFTSIKNRLPLFFAHLGDMGYSEITTNDKSLFFANYDGVLTNAIQGPMYRAVPTSYVWDDHDFGGDNSDSTSAATPAAQATFRQCVPTAPLQVSDGIYRSFRIGRVRFIVTDLRSFRSVDSATDNSSKTMMGATQKTWFKNELLAAKAAGDQAIFWLSSSVWNVLTPFTGVDVDNDHWGAFSTERTEIADFVKANSITGLVVCCGDAHSIGYARAKNCDFATGGGAPIPVLLASALDQTQTTRGGNWSAITTSADAGQYGYVNVVDDGNSLTWDYHSIHTDSTTGVDAEVLAPFRPAFIPANPPVRSGLTVLRDWDPATLVSLKDGDRIASWADRAAADAVANATANNQPTFRNTDAGYPVAHFTNNNSLSSSSLVVSTSTPTTIVCVVRRLSDHLANAGYIFDGLSSTTRRGMLYNNVAGQPYRMVNGTSVFTGPSSDTEMHTLVGVYGTTEALYVDGVQAATFSGVTLQALAGLRIGAKNDGTTFGSFELARLVVYSGAATSGDVAALNGWAVGTYQRGSGLFVVDRGMLVAGRLSAVVG